MPRSDPAPRTRRSHGRTTMADVARQAGVTKITVSRYLREPERVAPETAERIRAAMAEQAYVPHKPAGLLASGRSRMVAAIVPSLANSVFAETVQGLADALQASGHELLLAATGYQPQREEEQIRAVLAWSPDALAVTGRHHTAGALSMLRQAVSEGTPIVEMWDRHARGAEFLQVGFDHAQVGRVMAQHLLRLGHRRLVYVDTGVAADFRAHERGQAFVKAARSAPGVRAWVMTAPAGDAFDAGRAALAALEPEIPRRGVGLAVACANDHLACGVWLEAQARSIEVPRQIALVGFGDFPLARQLGDGLSSVRPPRYEIGQQTAALMLRVMRDGVPLAELRSPPEVRWDLVVRGSTG